MVQEEREREREREREEWRRLVERTVQEERAEWRRLVERTVQDGRERNGDGWWRERCEKRERGMEMFASPLLDTQVY